MVKNLPCNTGDVVMVPVRKTKIPHTVEQLSPCITTKAPCNQINILKNKLIKDQLSGYELTGFLVAQLVKNLPAMQKTWV